jgi:predicted Zn-ribbon and HTH transcriptional regulator
MTQINSFSESSVTGPLVCKKCGANIPDTKTLSVDFKTRKKFRKIPSGGSITLVVLGLFMLTMVIGNWEKAKENLPISLPLILLSLMGGLFLMYRHYKREKSILFMGDCTGCGYKMKKWAEESPVPSCPKCDEIWVFQQDVHINPKTGTMYKITPLTGGIFAILFGSLALFVFIMVQLLPDVKGSGLYYLILGLIFISGGISSILAYKKTGKTILSKYECADCRHKWEVRQKKKNK